MSAIQVFGGAFEGAGVVGRETALWRPSFRSPDAAINPIKDLADARGRDTSRNDPLAYGAVARHKDRVVGATFRLNAQPNIRVLQDISKSFDDKWLAEFQEVVEARFGGLAESNRGWLDAMGVNTFTGMIRLGVGVFLLSGEIIATAEWKRGAGRPINSAVQFVASERLSNPNGVSDSRFLRRGVERDIYGAAQAYNFRMGDAFDLYPDDLSYTWRNVPAYKPWGRSQVIHIVEQQSPDQTRGVSDMMAALKNMRMTRRFNDITLQSAVVNATYAAAIESELPSDMIAAAMGGGNGTSDLMSLYTTFMTALGGYLDDANNIRIEGAQIPHLFPGTKLQMLPAKTAGGVGTSFEESLHRHTAAALGMSYEEFTRDFSKTNYSSGRASMGVSGDFMASRKKHVADRLAGEIYSLVLEEWMGDDLVPLPRGVNREVFYLPLAKEAFTTATWIGSGTGQIDELKETQAALLRISGGISTYQVEGARLGLDWRDLMAQRAKENGVMKELDLSFNATTTKPAGGPVLPEEPEEPTPARAGQQRQDA